MEGISLQIVYDISYTKSNLCSSKGLVSKETESNLMNLNLDPAAIKNNSRINVFFLPRMYFILRKPFERLLN